MVNLVDSVPLNDRPHCLDPHCRVDEPMDLYRHGVVLTDTDGVKVESWWWQCDVCGFILPAQRWSHG